MIPIKVGILVNANLKLSEWLFNTIKSLIDDHVVIVEALIINENSSNKPSVGERIKSLPYTALWKIDNFIFARKSSCFKLHDAKLLLDKGGVAIKAGVNRKGIYEELNDETIEKVKDLQLDIILRGGFRILKGAILTDCSKFGVWSFHHGDNKKYRGMPAAFWEVYLNDDTISAILQILKPELDNGTIIGNVRCSVIKHSYSLTQIGLYQQASVLLSSRIKYLYNHGWAALINEYSVKYISNFYTYPLRKTPSFIVSSIAVFKQLIKWVKIKANNLNFAKSRWVIGYSEQKGLDISLHRFKYLIPPKDMFWADPFVITHNTKTFLFFEESPLIGKGHIAMLEYHNKSFDHHKIVLNEKFHLSYPFVFEHDGDLLMIPETKSISEIRLYKFNNSTFEYQRTLIHNIDAVDATLYFYSGKYWLFCAVASHPRSMANELHIYYADNLVDEFVAHKMNPVKIDVVSSRPAGNIISMNGKLIRPAQDGSKTYGYAIHFMHIIRLSETEYEEEVLDHITPTWRKDLTAVHTFNQNEKITVIDVNGKF
jgi:hypothetical protein